jgi:hypothetical protein
MPFLKTLTTKIQQGVSEYTEGYTKTPESPDYQLGDVAKTTLRKVHVGISGGFQRSLLRVCGTESPTMRLFGLLNTVRHDNQLDILNPHEGLGLELHTLIQTRFTPIEVSEFSSAWWSSGIDGVNVWTETSFQAFRNLRPFLE